MTDPDVVETPDDPITDEDFATEDEDFGGVAF